MKTLEGTLVYVMVDKPRKCYEESKGEEWKAGIVVDEDTADEFGEIYAKQGAKKVKTSEFEALYSCPPPEGAGKNVYVITLRKNTKLANGNLVPEIYQPKVLMQDGDNTVDITKTKLVGNGSKGMISIDHYDGKMGAVARLKNIFVTELIEYIAPEGSTYQAGDEFKTTAKAQPEAKKPAAKSAKAKQEDADSPF